MECSPSIIHRRRIIRPRQIQMILRIPSRIALVRQFLILANLKMVRRHILRLEVQRCFDDGGEEAFGDVPIDVAVESPDACSGC